MIFYNNKEKELGINKTRYELVANWFYSIYAGETNDTILVICGMDRGTVQALQQFMQKISHKQLKERFYQIEQFENFQRMEKVSDKNIILSANNGIEFEVLQQTKRILLFIDISILTMNGILEAGFNQLYNDINLYSSVPKMEESEHSLYYIQQKDPIKIVYQDIAAIQNSLYLLLNNNRLYRYKNLNSIFLRNKKFDIINDLNCLDKYGVLTSRLAIAIYKVACLNATANETEVGNFCRTELGISSKNFSNKHFNMSSVKSYRLKKYNANEEAIRVEIAKNLFALTQLDKHVISQATNLSTQTVLELEAAFDVNSNTY